MKPNPLCIAFAFAAACAVFAQESKDVKPDPAKPQAGKPSLGDSKAGDQAEKAAGRSNLANPDTAKSVHEFTVKDIDGNDVSLKKYEGKVLLVVNVASECGLTPQYEQLQKLHETYSPKGLVVLGFPANNFGGQEPGGDAEIKKFCSDKYRVGFDMFSKVSVKGGDCCALYKWLTGERAGGNKFAGEIKWNFTKFLIDPEGKIIARFEPRTKPDEKSVIEAIEKALPGSKSIR
ncbi:MAG: glutathione peroxidase [Phycisphaerales bacterium]|nr:glutathione peroxidase [Phycisphaerales bacterium]